MNRTLKQQAIEAVIEQTWHDLETELVGARELRIIQQALKNKLGSAMVSPAQIARTLADLGAQLRHPEVLNADLAWRQAQVETLFESLEDDFGTIAAALKSMDRLNMLRLAYLENEDVARVENLRQHIMEIKSDRRARQGKVAREVAQWLTIWLQNPEIFADWLDLRRGSSDFVSNFGEID